MKNECPYCGEEVEHDGMDQYIQCSVCGEISEYKSDKLKPTNVDELPA
jgi:tRNA(Ile2) C34 agmatinyltransferase TiaS